jgi:hypothetical protein
MAQRFVIRYALFLLNSGRFQRRASFIILKGD